jgi:hypothetical protein
MPLANVLAELKNTANQCDGLIAAAHRTDAAGANLFIPAERQQITVAAFLNLFIAWETFLEASLSQFMAGEPTINGVQPVKYVSPPSKDHALRLVIGVMRFFDYGNHDNVRALVNLYFEQGRPYEPHLSGMIGDLADIRTIRNACAHISSTTQSRLETLALRVTGASQIGVDAYKLLMMIDPGSHGNTVYNTLRSKLVTAAELIANG